jgi:hypothetical protein
VQCGDVGSWMVWWGRAAWGCRAVQYNACTQLRVGARCKMGEGDGQLVGVGFRQNESGKVKVAKWLRGGGGGAG